MKAKSKWLAIFLVLGLVLAACGDGGGDDETLEMVRERGGDGSVQQFSSGRLKEALKNSGDTRNQVSFPGDRPS